MKESQRVKPIRAFTKEDIPQVADLYRRLLLSETPSWRMLPSDALPAYFEQTMFHNPWYSPELPSLVYQDAKGKVIGFQGVAAKPMMLGNRPIRVAVCFHLMVQPESRSSMAGLQLSKTLFAGPQDLSLTDGAGELGRKVWEGVGGASALLYSQRWIRILRPSQLALEMARKHSSLRQIATMLLPLSALPDKTLRFILPDYFPSTPFPYNEESLDVETMLACMPQFAKNYSLRPVYDRNSLTWLLDQASQLKSAGEFNKLLVRNEQGEVIGWYLYYIKRGGMSTVIHIASKINFAGEVLDHLFEHAHRHGVIALTGRAYPQYLQELSDRFCYFRRAGNWMLIQSNDDGLLHTIQRGDAFLTELEGEWCFHF